MVFFLKKITLIISHPHQHQRRNRGWGGPIICFSKLFSNIYFLLQSIYWIIFCYKVYIELYFLQKPHHQQRATEAVVLLTQSAVKQGRPPLRDFPICSSTTKYLHKNVMIIWGPLLFSCQLIDQYQVSSCQEVGGQLGTSRFANQQKILGFILDQINNANSAIIFLINLWLVRVVRVVWLVSVVKVVRLVRGIQVVQVVKVIRVVKEVRAI